MDVSIIPNEPPKENLAAYLARRAESRPVSFHMPGHKGLLDERDITELPGADNLHAPTGVLAALLRDMAALAGAERSFLSVNGSTAGMLAAALTVSQDGDAVLCARNAHRALVGGLALSGAVPAYVLPKPTSCGFPGGVDPADIERALDEHPGIKAVFITSPTYEGAVSDVAAIAAITRDHRIPLIVDEAHGAHFLHAAFPTSAIRLGADVVVQSLHKTLPAFTQTAAVHCRAPYAERLARFLSIVQTSSPSYVFMGRAAQCIDLLTRQGGRLFEAYAARLAAFRAKAADFKNIRLVGKDHLDNAAVFDIDAGKLVFLAANAERLAERLAEEHNIWVEAAHARHLIAMTSVYTDDGAFAKLYAAIEALDAAWPPLPPIPRQTYALPEIVCSPRAALSRPSRPVPLAEAVGHVSAGFAVPYPPGIPTICPGERVTEAAAALGGAERVEIMESSI